MCLQELIKYIVSTIPYPFHLPLYLCCMNILLYKYIRYDIKIHTLLYSLGVSSTVCIFSFNFHLVGAAC